MKHLVISLAVFLSSQLLFADLSSLTISVQSRALKRSAALAVNCIELMVTGPDGKRTGYLGKKKENLKEIPKANYFDEESNRVGKDRASNASKELWIENPSSGTYVLQIIGTKTGIYTANFHIQDKSARGRQVIIKGVISKGKVHEVKVNYQPESVHDSKVAKSVSLSFLMKECQLAAKHFFSSDKTIGKEMLAHLKKVKSHLARKKIDLAKESMQKFIAKVKEKKEDPIDEQRKWVWGKEGDDDAPPSALETAIDALMDDAKTFLANLEK